MNDRLQAWAYDLMERFFAFWPRKTPSRDRLAACRLIAHRGDHFPPHRLENTMAAFDAADRARVWGIELDLRWTADMEPVVCHDLDLARVFGLSERIGELAFARLRKIAPLVPHLAEVVGRYGGRRHLMLEIKSEPYPNPVNQGQRLMRILAPLHPKQDYHFLCFDSLLFDRLEIEPKDLFIPIARLNARELSNQALSKGYGGLSGHYLLVRRFLLDRHRHAGQQTGTGFINSRNCLFRQIHRQVDWLFSDCAVKMQQTVDDLVAGKTKRSRIF